MKKSLLSLAMAASLGLASVPVLAGIYNASTDAGDITIQEGAITGAVDNQIIADQLAGVYDEIFTVTGANTFNTLAVFSAGSWNIDGSAVGSQLNTAENLFGGAGYALYAIFQSDGTFAIDLDGNVTFSGGTGSIMLYADPLQNTTATLPGSAPAGADLGDITRVNIEDDLLLGSAELLTFGEGTGNTAGTANGDFELIFGDWELADPNGLAYFIAPRPFYMILDLNGNFQEFNPTPGGTIRIEDSVANAFFVRQVPEPATLALLGMGLVGMGLGLRRRKAA